MKKLILWYGIFVSLCSSPVFAAQASPVALNIQPSSVQVSYGAVAKIYELNFYIVNQTKVKQQLYEFSLVPLTHNTNIVVLGYSDTCHSVLPPSGSAGICNIYARIKVTGAQRVGQKIGPFNYRFSLRYGPRKQILASTPFPISFADGTLLSGANRTFTFLNQCNFPVWLGVDSGATNSIKPDASQSPPNLTSCLSNADCYPGSTCVTVNSSLKECYWANPAPNDAPSNYELDAKGGVRTSTTVTFPAYNNGIDLIWTGGAAARTACSSGTCETANCGGTGTGACPLGGGFATPASKVEFSLLNKNPLIYTNTPNSNTDKDTYDVTVVDGVSVSISMQPTNGTWGGAANPYTCGTPGNSTAQSPLGACAWTFSPPALPSGMTATDYVWVKSDGSNDCTACPGLNNSTSTPNTLVCGVSYDPSQPAGSHLKKGCGTQLGYWSADTLCGKDPTSPIISALSCGAQVQGSLTYADLYACKVGELHQSCYTTPVNTCCGCVDWNTLGVTIPLPPLTQSCVPAHPTSTSPPNPNWTMYSQPILTWLKSGCPTAYVYPYDDASSTFSCSALNGSSQNVVNYTITFCPENG